MINLPPIDLLEKASPNKNRNNPKNIKEMLVKTTKDKNLFIDISRYEEGPSYTRFYTTLEKQTTYNDIKELENDIALAVKSPNGKVFITEPIEGTGTFGIDVPNKYRSLVSLRDALENANLEKEPSFLNIPLGITNDGEFKTFNLQDQPHILIGGSVCGGKSSFLNMVINTLLLRSQPEELKLILVDTKKVEFFPYKELPNLLFPVITDVPKSVKVLEWLVEEMMKRYILFEKEKVRNIVGFNKKTKSKAMPYIIFVVDELSDLICHNPVVVEKSILRLARLSRATGVHMILTAQRASTEIFTGLIKSEIPSKICFNIMSQIDSRVVLDHVGAEGLLGKGDLLYKTPNTQKLIRAQAPYISEKEIENVVSYIKEQEEPNYTGLKTPELKQLFIEALKEAKRTEKKKF